MTVAMPVRGQKSTVYVLAKYTMGRPTKPYNDSPLYTLYEDGKITATDGDTAIRLNSMLKKRREERVTWQQHHSDWLATGDTSEMWGMVLDLLDEKGIFGATAAEARTLLGINSDGVSGCLSHFHRAGVVHRLDEKR